MEKHEWLAEAFEAERSHLQAVAYRVARLQLRG